MPELPEVELCKRQLAAWAAGRELSAVRVDDPATVRSRWSTRPSDADPAGAERLAQLVGCTPAEPDRHGKRLVWMFGERGLLIHLGMTGQWLRRSSDEDAPPSARVGMLFGSQMLWFVDRRRFGCLIAVDREEGMRALSAGLGPDALRDALDGPALAAALPGRRALKVALLDQQRIAGLGNIHAAEACYRARVDPRTPCEVLGPVQWRALAEAIRMQLAAALADLPVDRALTYVTDGGDNPFAVYKRAGEPCLRCGDTVTTAKQGGRSTFWCPGCQHRPSSQ